MIKREQFIEAKHKAVQMIRECGIVLNQNEIDEMDVTDFGLNHLYVEGGQMLGFFNTNRVSAKVIAMFPRQTLPEHWHTAFDDNIGKEETIRVAKGTLYLCIEGEDTLNHAVIPDNKTHCYTARKEYVMRAGDQITLEPGIKHWFQGGDEGAVVYSFSSAAKCALDPFTDNEIVRITQIED